MTSLFLHRCSSFHPHHITGIYMVSVQNKVLSMLGQIYTTREHNVFKPSAYEFNYAISVVLLKQILTLL